MKAIKLAYLWMFIVVFDVASAKAFIFQTTFEKTRICFYSTTAQKYIVDRLPILLRIKSLHDSFRNGLGLRVFADEKR